jgi:hypothetical protein
MINMTILGLLTIGKKLKDFDDNYFKKINQERLKNIQFLENGIYSSDIGYKYFYLAGAIFFLLGSLMKKWDSIKKYF